MNGTERPRKWIKATGPDGGDFFSQRQLLLVAAVVIACGAWDAYWRNWRALPAFAVALFFIAQWAWRGRREGTRRW